MRNVILIMLVAAGLLFMAWLTGTQSPGIASASGEKIVLPEPRTNGPISVEKALQDRRSVREYKNEALALSDLSQLLWAAQGISSKPFRTSPSAGALYPLEVYAVVGQVNGLSPGVYRYIPAEHSITRVRDGDRRDDLYRTALRQPSVKDAPIDLVIAGVYERTTGKYGSADGDEATGASYPRGVKYVHMEAGHSSQNLYLQAESLGLGTVTIGAFDDGEVKQILGMAENERPLYIMPVGRPK